MPTVQQLLTDINARLPNQFSDTDKVRWMNDVQNEIWRYMASTEVYEFSTVAGQAIYSLASDVAVDQIKNVQVSNSTVVDGTEGYLTYTYAGPNDQLIGNRWYDALGQMGLYPVPSSDDGDGYNVKVTYEASPTQLSTNTLNVVPDVNVEYQDILKFRVLKTIAASGNDPDVSLTNNYQREEDAIMKKIRMDYYKRGAARPRDTWSYREGWWNG